MDYTVYIFTLTKTTNTTPAVNWTEFPNFWKILSAISTEKRFGYHLSFFTLRLQTTETVTEVHFQILGRPFWLNQQNNRSWYPFDIFTLIKATNATQMVNELNFQTLGKPLWLNQQNKDFGHAHFTYLTLINVISTTQMGIELNFQTMGKTLLATSTE